MFVALKYAGLRNSYRLPSFGFWLLVWLVIVVREEGEDRRREEGGNESGQGTRLEEGGAAGERRATKLAEHGFRRIGVNHGVICLGGDRLSGGAGVEVFWFSAGATRQSVSLRVSQLMNKGQAESQSTSQPTSSLTLTLTLADRSVGQTNQVSR